MLSQMDSCSCGCVAVMWPFVIVSFDCNILDVTEAAANECMAITTHFHSTSNCITGYPNQKEHRINGTSAIYMYILEAQNHMAEQASSMYIRIGGFLEKGKRPHTLSTQRGEGEEWFEKSEQTKRPGFIQPAQSTGRHHSPLRKLHPLNPVKHNSPPAKRQGF